MQTFREYCEKTNLMEQPIIVAVICHQRWSARRVTKDMITDARQLARAWLKKERRK